MVEIVTCEDLDNLPQHERWLWLDLFNGNLPGTFCSDSILIHEKLGFWKNKSESSNSIL